MVCQRDKYIKAIAIQESELRLIGRTTSYISIDKNEAQLRRRFNKLNDRLGNIRVSVDSFVFEDKSNCIDYPYDNDIATYNYNDGVYYPEDDCDF